MSMKTIIWLLGALLLIGVVKAAFVWSGAYNIAADEPHWRLTERLIETLRNRSIERRSSDIAVPKLDDESLIRGGAGNYDAMCAGCHLKPGLESTEQSRGLYPAPPDLTKKRVEDPAAAFWTIKHGVKMTGMPAWGKSMEDPYIWGMVAFLRELPDLSRDRYDALVEASGGHRHGGTETVPAGTEAEKAGRTHATEPHSHDDDHSKAPPHEH
jgi:mono/diheme cytochrome c family protein